MSEASPTPRTRRGGGHKRPRTPAAMARFIESAVSSETAPQAAPSPEALRAEVGPPAAPHVPQRVEPVQALPYPDSKPAKEATTAPDPWEVLRQNLPPQAWDALLQVLPNAPRASAGDAPWFECWDPAEGRPTGHPAFQASHRPGEHVYCPHVDPASGRVCNRRSVQPLENYVPLTA